MSELKIKIQIENILEVETGVSSNGEWSKVSFIGTEMDSEYPKQIGFEIFGKEKVDKFLQYNKVGSEVEVSFNLQSREHNGKIYTTAFAWKVWGLQSTSAAPVPEIEEDEIVF